MTESEHAEVERLRTRMESNASWERYEAIQALRKIGGTAVFDIMLVALDEPRDEVQEEAAAALGEIGDARAVEALIAALQDTSRFATVRRNAATALGHLADRRAVPVLVEALADEAPNVRWAAARALGALGDARAGEAISNLLDDPIAEVAAAASEALATLGVQREGDPPGRAVFKPVYDSAVALIEDLSTRLDELPVLTDEVPWWSDNCPYRTAGSATEVLDALRGCCERDISWAHSAGASRWQFQVGEMFADPDGMGWGISFLFDLGMGMVTVQHIVYKDESGFVLRYHLREGEK